MSPLDCTKVHVWYHSLEIGYLQDKHDLKIGGWFIIEIQEQTLEAFIRQCIIGQKFLTITYSGGWGVWGSWQLRLLLQVTKQMTHHHCWNHPRCVGKPDHYPQSAKVCRWGVSVTNLSLLDKTPSTIHPELCIKMIINIVKIIIHPWVKMIIHSCVKMLVTPVSKW